MLDTRARGYIQKCVDGFAKYSLLTKLHPNQITTLAFVVGVVSAVFIAFSKFPIAAVLLWVSGALDVLDGTVARLTGKTSKLGGYLDLVFDRMVEAAVILGFFFYAPQNALIYLLFFVSVLFNFSTFMLAGSLFQNEGKKSMHYDVGIVERTETFIVFTLMLIFPKYLDMFLLIFIALVFLTGIIRMYKIVMFERTNKENED